MIKKTDKKIRVLFGLVFVVMLVFSMLTPMLADDYTYSFGFSDSSRITSLTDIFKALAVHRLDINGRMTAHFFAYLFLLLPKVVFCVCNAVLVVLLLARMLRFAEAFVEDRQVKVKFMILLFLIFSVWIFTPVFGQVFLWLDGACNYSWSCFFCITFLYPFFLEYACSEKEDARTPVRKLLCFLVSFLAGSYSEGGSFGIVVTAFIFCICILYEKRKLSHFLIVSFVCACLGYLFLMTAPAEWSGRVGTFDILQMAKNFKRVLIAPWESFPALFCLYAVLLALCFCCRVDRRIIVSVIVLFIGAWATLALFVAAVYFPWRSLLPMVILLSIACAVMLSGLYYKTDKLLPVILALMAMVFFFEFLSGAGDIAYVYYQFGQRENTIQTAIDNGEAEVHVSMYEADTKYSGPYLLPDVYEDPYIWPNYDLARYYGIDCVYGDPVEAEEY